MRSGKLRGAGFSVVAALAALAFVAAASASPALDQEQAVIDTQAEFVYAIGGPSEQKLAQVITPAVTGMLTEVSLSAACGTDLTVEVQDVVDGAPDGIVRGSETVPFALPFPTTFRSIPLTTPVPVTAGAPYALVLTTTDSCGIWPGPLGDPYPGGDAFFDSRPNPPGWLPLGPPRNDLPFQTVVDTTDTTAPVARCVNGTNPAGRNVRTAGFWQVLASDDVALSSIVIRDGGSDFVSSPLSSGDQLKITRAPGATPSERSPGPGVLAAHLTLRGDAILRATDTSGNVTQVSCGS